MEAFSRPGLRISSHSSPSTPKLAAKSIRLSVVNRFAVHDGTTMKRPIGLVLLLLCLIVCAWPAGSQTLPSPSAVTSACHVSPIVSDLDKSAHFYRDVIGLDLVPGARSRTIYPCDTDPGHLDLHELNKHASVLSVHACPACSATLNSSSFLASSNARSTAACSSGRRAEEGKQFRDGARALPDQSPTHTSHAQHWAED
jgi:hypothetical protein